MNLYTVNLERSTVPALAPDRLFSSASTAALLAWLALVASLFVPAARRWTWRVTGVLLPAVFGAAYVAALAAGVRGGDPAGGFGSVAAVRALFADDFALTAGWLHYLAFDLVVGTAIARAGLGAGVPRPLLLPCLALTFLVGPAGLVAYLLLRAAAGRRSWEPLT